MATLITIFMFVMAIKTFVSAQCDYMTATPNFQRSVYEFTLKLVKIINKETGSHFVVSTLTPWTLLATMTLDESHTVFQEIREVLQLPTHSCAVHLYLELMFQVTTKPNNPASSKLERCSTIFFNASLNINQSFFDVVSKGGIWNSRIMNFENRTVTASNINYRVRKTMEAKFRIVLENDLVDLTTITIDALSFRGAWQIPLSCKDYGTDPFYNDAGQPIGDVAMMYLWKSFNVTLVSQIQASVLELPYDGAGDVSRYSMLIFLPEDNVSLIALLESMNTINLTSIFNLYERDGPKNITVQIPRFTITSIFIEWRKLLKGLGINTIFEQQKANASNISYYQLFLTNYKQKVHFSVDSEGTKIKRAYTNRDCVNVAASRLMQSRFVYDQFVANKPFMYMIVERLLHVPIFTGAYSKPSIHHPRK